MAYIITDDCIKCGTCIDECPNEAISEDDTKYIIDPAPTLAPPRPSVPPKKSIKVIRP